MKTQQLYSQIEGQGPRIAWLRNQPLREVIGQVDQMTRIQVQRYTWSAVQLVPQDIVRQIRHQAEYRVGIYPGGPE